MVSPYRSHQSEQLLLGMVLCWRHYTAEYSSIRYHTVMRLQPDSIRSPLYDSCIGPHTCKPYRSFCNNYRKPPWFLSLGSPRIGSLLASLCTCLLHTGYFSCTGQNLFSCTTQLQWHHWVWVVSSGPWLGSCCQFERVLAMARDWHGVRHGWFVRCHKEDWIDKQLDKGFQQRQRWFGSIVVGI